MNFTYENQGINTYLVYTLSTDESIDSMSMGMLSNNKIPGLASTMFTQMDSTRYVKYNVSAKVPVTHFFAGAVNKKRLLGVFKGIVSAIMSAEDYMINESTILLDLDYIFADVSTCETILICLPIDGVVKQHDLGAFFKGIMFSTQFDQTENCDYVAKVINYLNSSPLFSLSDFIELLHKIEQDESAAPTAPQQRAADKEVPNAATNPVAVSQNPQVVKQPQVTIPAAVPTVTQPQSVPVNKDIPPKAAPTASTGNKEKGFSLFGLFSKPEKAQNKPQPAAKVADQKQQTTFEVPGAQAPKSVPGAQAQKAFYEIPGAQAQKSAFAIPGAQAQKPAYEIPGQSVPPVTKSAPTKQKAQTVQQTVNSIPQQNIKPTVNSAVTVASVPVQSVPTAGKPVGFGETTVLGGGKIGETTVLGVGDNPVKADPHLIRMKNNEKIPLNKPVFRIGKERSYVDYFISDNTAISRSHANIVNHNGEIYIVDTNSTNHTYVNGTMIHSNEEVKLSHGAKVRLANEDFEFRLY